MNNYWYVSRPNEIFIDLDHSEAAFNHYRRRLFGAIAYRRLPVKFWWEVPSNTFGHMHVFLFLRHPMNAIERYTWAIILRSDIYRGCATIMRELHNVGGADLIISNRSGLVHNSVSSIRHPDFCCTCNGKHKAKIMAQCPIAEKLRGINKLEGFFGIPVTPLHTIEF